MMVFITKTSKLKHPKFDMTELLAGQAPSFEAPNYKHQITNKSQIPIFNVQNV
jgi:hypothetical protein